LTGIKEGLVINTFINSPELFKSLARYSPTISFLLLIMFSASACSQDDFGTTVISDPPGAVISLEGEYYLNATSPCRLPETLNGYYRLRAIMPGYESWSGDVVLVPGQNNRIMVKLSQKTRLKASLRSLFIPGWGQYYSDQKGKAYLFNIATIGFGIGAIITDSDFRKKRDNYFRAQLDLENATGPTEIAELRSEVINRQRDAYDAETTRNVMVGITAGIYLYNVIDALIFFPKREFYNQGAGSSLIPAVSTYIDSDRVGLKLTASF